MRPETMFILEGALTAMIITPEQLAKGGTEHDHQKALFQWASLQGTPVLQLLYAIPNGSKLMGVGTVAGRIEGAKMKAEGLRSGVPDVFLPVAAPCPKQDPYEFGHWYHGLYIEMKKPGRQKEKWGGRSAEQLDWHGRLIKQGYAVVTAYGWTSGVGAVVTYLSGQLRMPNDGDSLAVHDG